MVDSAERAAKAAMAVFMSNGGRGEDRTETKVWEAAKRSCEATKEKKDKLHAILTFLSCSGGPSLSCSLKAARAGSPRSDYC